jgi:hypothetical protein
MLAAALAQCGGGVDWPRGHGRLYAPQRAPGAAEGQPSANLQFCRRWMLTDTPGTCHIIDPRHTHRLRRLLLPPTPSTHAQGRTPPPHIAAPALTQQQIAASREAAFAVSCSCRRVLQFMFPLLWQPRHLHLISGQRPLVNGLGPQPPWFGFPKKGTS